MVSNGRYWLPSSITFKLNEDSRENRYRIWFADESFQQQYDKYEIEVIPPIPNIDDFHKGVAKVKSLLTDHTAENGYRIEKLHQRVNDAANKFPYTYIKTNTYNYVNPGDSKEIIPTSWTVIIYGEAGRNDDVIRDEVAKYVIRNTQHTRPEWEKLLPDLFTPTEYYLCPLWTKIATENLQLMGGIYSSAVSISDSLDWARRTMIGYGFDHITANGSIVSTIFKSITMITCGHPKNRITSAKFQETWKDYCNIYTTSRDFNRISPETQEFILFMNRMLVEAETLTPDTEIPKGMTRLKRGDLYYLSAQHMGVSYLMPIRWNFLSEIKTTQKSSIKLPTVNPQGQQTPENDGRIGNVIDLTPNIGLRP